MLNHRPDDPAGGIIRPARVKFYERNGYLCGRILFSDGTLSDEFQSCLGGELEIFDALVKQLIVHEEAMVLSQQLGASKLPLSLALLEETELREKSQGSIEPRSGSKRQVIIRQRARLN